MDPFSRAAIGLLTNPTFCTYPLASMYELTGVSWHCLAKSRKPPKLPSAHNRQLFCDMPCGQTSSFAQALHMSGGNPCGQCMLFMALSGELIKIPSVVLLTR